MKPSKKTDRTVITLLILCLTFGVLFFMFSILFQNSNSPKNPNKPSGWSAYWNVGSRAPIKLGYNKS